MKHNGVDWSLLRGVLGLGALLIWSGPTLAEGDAKNGDSLYGVYCAGCHFVHKAMGKSVGPNLSGVLGRKAGTFPGYSYSSAMRSAAFVWTEALLMRYLASPEALVPANIMAFYGFADGKERRDVIAYLKSQQGK